MYYEQFGSGKPLLMLHGKPLDHRSMANDMEPIFMNRSGWRRLYPDLPGMGKTPAPDWLTHQDQVLDLIIDFINAVIPGERFALAGISFGGYLARGLVHRRGAQIDGLFLGIPVIEPVFAKRDLPTHLVVHEDAEFLAALAPDEQDLKAFYVAQSMEALADFRQFIAPAVEIADQVFSERLRPNIAFSFDVDALPAPFPAPTLVLAGRQDHWCGYREAYRLLDNYPRASYIVLDRAGHALLVEQKTLFQALMNEWLDRVEEYAQGG
jgi:pimeloyl-ACP methyl ester carboxylesterase